MNYSDDYAPPLPAEPEASATPRDEPAHASRPEHTPTCPTCGGDATVPDGVAWYCLVHAPKDARHRFDEARRDRPPSPDAGVISYRHVFDVRDRDAAEDWYYREPQRAEDAHHDEPIMVGGREFYQRPPPVHVRGASPVSPRVHRTVAREISEAVAERMHARHALRIVGVEALNLSPSRVAREKVRRSR